MPDPIITLRGTRTAYAAPDMMTITGMEVFSEGEWTDSEGRTDTYTNADIDKLAQSDPSMVALKAGHTSEGFNQRIAESLGVPLELVEGEGPDGNGALALGRATALRNEGGKLVADWEAVPKPIADLIQSELFNGASAEIWDVGGPEMALTGVALLGAENPAVDLAPLVEAGIHGKRLVGAHAYVATATPQSAKFAATLVNLDDLAAIASIKKDQTIMGRLKAILVGDDSDADDDPQGGTNMSALTEALGLADDATEEMILAAIAELKGSESSESDHDDNKDSDDQDGLSDSEAMEKLDAALKRIEALEGDNATANHNATHAKWAARAAAWAAVSGKPSEIADLLTTTEEKAGLPAAEAMATAYQGQNDAQAAMLTPSGRVNFQNANPPAGDDPNVDPFMVTILKEAEAEKVTFQKVLARYMSSPDPAKKAAFVAYHEREQAKMAAAS